MKAALNLFNPASWKFPQKNIVPDILSANCIINSFIIKTAISVPPTRPRTLLSRFFTLALAVSVLFLIFITVKSPYPWEMRVLEKLRQDLRGISTTLKQPEQEHGSCHLSIHHISPPSRGCTNHSGLRSKCEGSLQAGLLLRGLCLSHSSDDLGNTRGLAPSTQYLETPRNNSPRTPSSSHCSVPISSCASAAVLSCKTNPYLS